MNTLYQYTFSSKSETHKVCATDLKIAMDIFKKESPFFLHQVVSIEIEKITSSKIAVIDLSVPCLELMEVPSSYQSEQVEEYLVHLGFKLSEILWGEYNHIVDRTETNKF